MKTVRLAILALLALLMLMQPALSQSPLLAGESEDLTIAMLPDGSLNFWYTVVHPVSALNRSATTVEELGIKGATLSVFFDGSDGPFILQLEVYGNSVTEKAATDLASSIARDLNLKLNLNSSTGSSYLFTSRLTLTELRMMISELKPLTKSGGFAPYIDIDYLRRFKGAHIVVEIVRFDWGVSTSFEVRAFGDRLQPSGDRYTIDVLKLLGVNELRASEGAFLNVMVFPPFGSKSVAYEVSPSDVAVRELVQGMGTLYVQLYGGNYLRRFVVEFSFNGTSIESFLGKFSDFMAFVEELERTGSLLNRTSHMRPLPTGGITGLPRNPEETNETTPGTTMTLTRPSEGTATITSPTRDRIRSLPPVSGPERRGISVDPLLILGLAVLAVGIIAFGTLYVNRGLKAAAKGSAVLTLSLLLITAIVLPVIAIGTAYGQQRKGGLEPLVEVEQFIPGSTPPDLEVPLLFPAFKQIDKISKTFISFEDIKVIATPSLYAPYTPQGFQKLLATVGIDMRLIQAAGLILGGGINPLGMFKDLTLAHGVTSAFITGESAGANVYMVFKAKPTTTLQLILDAIYFAYQIGHWLSSIPIPIPIIHAIGNAIKIAVIFVAASLAIIAPYFTVYAYASYPSLVNDLYITWGAVDGSVVENKERVWLAENRVMVSLAILTMILRAPTLSGWRGSEGLADIPLTASFHVSSDADSGWKINRYLGVYSGDRGLKVAVDFRDAVGIWSLFKDIFDAIRSARSDTIGKVAEYLKEVDEGLNKIKKSLQSVNGTADAMSYVRSAIGKIENAQKLLRDAQKKLNNNCPGAAQNINGAKESISSAIEDLDAAVRIDSSLKDRLNQTELQKIQRSLEGFNKMLNNFCASYNFDSNFKAEPLADPELLPDDQKMTLTFLVFSATPLVTQVINGNGSSVIELRAYYGWNPFPGIVQGVAVSVRSVFVTVRDIAYNAVDQLSSATSTIGELAERDLNRGIESLLNNLGIPLAGESSGAPTQILGSLVNMVTEIKSTLTTLKYMLVDFLDWIAKLIQLVFETVKKLIQELIDQLENAINNVFGIVSRVISVILGSLIDEVIKPLRDKLKTIDDQLMKLMSKMLEAINAIKQKINEWHQIISAIDGWTNQLLGPIYNVLSVVRLDLSKLPGSGGSAKIGSSVKSIIGEFTSGALSKARNKVEDAVRKLNEQERKILGALVRVRDAMIFASSMIRIPIIGRGGMMQATLFEIGESAVSDDYGYLGTIVVPHDVVKPVAGWYNEFTLVLHPVGGVVPFSADYSYVAPFLQDLIDLVNAPPPSVLWVKVNEVGPVLRGNTIDIAILGDPKRPSVPGGRESSRVYVALPDGTVRQLSLDSLPTIRPYDWPSSAEDLLGPFFPFPPAGPLLAPFFPFPMDPPPVALNVNVFEEPVEDPSARSVPRVLVPADTATGTVLLAPFFPFPFPGRPPPAA
jgi:hypothetical protein